MQVAEKSESQLDQRVCPNCGESCEKEYETVFVMVRNSVSVVIPI
tara:strand:- start:198 stop:332 length:135 start_codon:yes stop_codon:yes gene_type:complete